MRLLRKVQKAEIFFLKLNKYKDAGVREYWVVDPLTSTVNVYEFDEKYETGGDPHIYSFEDEAAFCIFPELKIRISDYLLS